MLINSQSINSSSINASSGPKPAAQLAASLVSVSSQNASLSGPLVALNSNIASQATVMAGLSTGISLSAGLTGVSTQTSSLVFLVELSAYISSQSSVNAALYAQPPSLSSTLRSTANINAAMVKKQHAISAALLARETIGAALHARASLNTAIYGRAMSDCTMTTQIKFASVIANRSSQSASLESGIRMNSSLLCKSKHRARLTVDPYFFLRDTISVYSRIHRVDVLTPT